MSFDDVFHVRLYPRKAHGGTEEYRGGQRRKEERIDSEENKERFGNWTVEDLDYFIRKTLLGNSIICINFKTD